MDIGMRIAIDIGSKYSRLAGADGEGIMTERTVVAADEKDVIAVGNEAEELLTALPGKYMAFEPMSGGVVNDLDMFDVYVQQIVRKFRITRMKMLPPKVYASIRSSMNEVEREEIRSSLRSVAREVEFIEAPIAAVKGAGEDPSLPSAVLVLCLGGGGAEAAVVCMNRVIACCKVPLSGRDIEEEISSRIRRSLYVSVSGGVVEKLKLCGDITKDGTGILVTAKNIMTGLPVSANIEYSTVSESIKECLMKTAEEIRRMISALPNEMYADVMTGDILAVGGGACIKGLADYFKGALGLGVRISPEPEMAVIKGVRLLMEKERAKKIPLVISRDRALAE